MKVLIGLGNPGLRYRATRHNFGALLIDHLADSWGVSLRKQRGVQAYLGRTEHLGEVVVLARPSTYMNNSGPAVRRILEISEASPADAVLIVDDADLPLGTVRLRGKGSAGGHKGLASSIEALGTQEFARMRLGIMPQEGDCEDLRDFVLSTFRPSERRRVREVLGASRDALQVFVKEGLAKAMSLYNKSI